jgi:predicted acetyltransferase
MINNYREEGEPETDFQVAEFFVMYKYRRSGIGKQAFNLLLDKHKGKCGLKCVTKNTIAFHFWDKVINDLTNGQYELLKVKSEFPGGVDMFLFDNK